MAKPKDKNHAPPPPSFVIQPPGPDGLPIERYSMGKELGKGGFAICYEGTLVGQKRGAKVNKFALKIVKAKMGLKKMEEKVGSSTVSQEQRSNLVLVQNGTTNPFQNATSQHRGVPPSFHIRGKHIHCPRTLSQWLSEGYGTKAEVLELTGSTAIWFTTVWGNQVSTFEECYTSRSENGQYLLGSGHEHQAGRFWTSSYTPDRERHWGCQETNNAMRDTQLYCTRDSGERPERSRLQSGHMGARGYLVS